MSETTVREPVFTSVSQRLFDFGDLLKKTWGTYRKNMWKLALASLVVSLIVLLVFLIIMLISGAGITTLVIGTGHFGMSGVKTAIFAIIGFIIGFLFELAAMVIFTGTVNTAAIQAVTENAVSIKKSLKTGFKKFWGILGVMVRIFLYAWGWFALTIILSITIFAVINLSLMNSSENFMDNLFQNKIFENASAQDLLTPPMDLPVSIQMYQPDSSSSIRGIGSLVLGLLAFIGGVFTFFLGIYRFIRVNFSLPAFLETDRTAKEALEKSKQAAHGNFWRIFGYNILSGIVVGIPIFIIFMLFAFLMGSLAQILESKRILIIFIIGFQSLLMPALIGLFLTPFLTVFKYLFFKGLEQEKNLAHQPTSA